MERGGYRTLIPPLIVSTLTWYDDFMIKKVLATLAGAIVGMLGLSTPAFAGNPHFVEATATVVGNTITVDFKEAGLGNEEQVHVVLTADAQCVNRGGNPPQAANKQAVVAADDFPVQNGHVTGTLSVTATLSCSPPMTIVFSNVVLTDETSGISVNL